MSKINRILFDVTCIILVFILPMFILRILGFDKCELFLMKLGYAEKTTEVIG